MTAEQAAKIAVFALYAGLLVVVSVQAISYVKAYRQAPSWRAKVGVIKTKGLGLFVVMLLTYSVARVSWLTIGGNLWPVK